MTMCRVVNDFVKITAPKHVIDSQDISYGSLYQPRYYSSMLCGFTQIDIDSHQLTKLFYTTTPWRVAAGDHFCYVAIQQTRTKTDPPKFMPMETLGYKQVTNDGKIHVAYMIKCMVFFHSQVETSPLIVYIHDASFDDNFVKCEDL